jgi:tetratricopeptide (TPR) repeat protein
LKKSSKIAVVIIFLLLHNIFLAQAWSSRDESEYLNLTNEEIDLAYGSLLIEKAIFPDIQIQSTVEIIDKIAIEIKELLAEVKEPLEIITILNNYLFHYTKMENNDDCHFLINVINDKCGNCSSLSFFYLSISDRLNLPFYGVASPLHMFVRYNDETVRYSIGTTAEGKLISEEKLIENSNIARSSIENGVYLRRLSKKEILASVLNWRGIYYKEQGKYELAINDYKKALELNPKFPEAYSGLATAYKLNNDFVKSLEYSDIAISLNPNFAIALSNRGETKIRLKDYQGALIDFNLAIEIDPKCLSAFSKRGDLHYLLRDYNNALIDYSLAIEIDPNDGLLFNNRGTIYYLLHNNDKSLKDWEISSELGCREGTSNLKKFFPNKEPE